MDTIVESSSILPEEMSWHQEPWFSVQQTILETGEYRERFLGQRRDTLLCHSEKKCPYKNVNLITSNKFLFSIPYLKKNLGFFT